MLTNGELLERIITFENMEVVSSKVYIRKNSQDKTNKSFVYNISMELSHESSENFFETFKGIENNFSKININHEDIKTYSINRLENINSVELNLYEDYLPKNNKLFFHSFDKFEKYLELFSKFVRFEDLQDYQNKIIIKIIDPSEIDIRLNTLLFTNNTIEKNSINPFFIYDDIFKETKISGLYKLFPEAYVANHTKEIISSMLGIFFEKFYVNEDKFLMDKELRTIFSIDNVEHYSSSYTYLGKIQSFIYQDSDRYYDKLRIFITIFNEYVEKGINIKSTDLEKILNKLTKLYNQFITNKIEKFVDEKQKLLEDYLKLNSDINNRIQNITNDISKELLTFIGLCISTFISTSINFKLPIYIIPIITIAYLGFYLYLFVVKGWYFESQSIQKQKNRIEKTYDDIYVLDKEYKDELNKEFQQEIDKLKNIEKIHKNLIFFLFILSLCWCVWA